MIIVPYYLILNSYTWLNLCAPILRKKQTKIKSWLCIRYYLCIITRKCSIIWNQFISKVLCYHAPKWNLSISRWLFCIFLIQTLTTNIQIAWGISKWCYIASFIYRQYNLCLKSSNTWENFFENGRMWLRLDFRNKITLQCFKNGQNVIQGAIFQKIFGIYW